MSRRRRFCERCRAPSPTMAGCCGWWLCARCTTTGLVDAVRGFSLCRMCVRLRERLEVAGSIAPGSMRRVEHLGECSDCPGWAVFNADHDYLGEVQRCDTCRRYATDEDAWDAARAAGLLVDDEGYVLRDPRGTA